MGLFKRLKKIVRKVTPIATGLNLVSAAHAIAAPKVFGIKSTQTLSTLKKTAKISLATGAVVGGGILAGGAVKPLLTQVLKAPTATTTHTVLPYSGAQFAEDTYGEPGTIKARRRRRQCRNYRGRRYCRWV